MPFVSSLKKFLTDEDIFGTDTSMSEFHTKNNPGLGEITLYGYVERMAKGIFGDFKDGRDRIRKMQLLQCEWIRLSLELYRRNQWYSSGIVYWMYNDCWPAANGWSIVDYYGNPKPGYYAFRRAAAPIIASIAVEEGKTRVYVSVNGAEAAAGKGRLYRYNIVTGMEDNVHEFIINGLQGGTQIAVESENIELDANTVLLCDIATGLGTDRAFYLPLRWADMHFASCDPVIVDEDEHSITVKAKCTLPMAIVDDNGRMLSDNGMFMKIGETRVLSKM